MGRYFSVGAGFLLLLGFAFAAETLRQSDPPSGSTLRVWPQAVTLNFTAAIEPHRSQFRAYRLETNARDPQIIKAAALALSSRAFAGKVDASKRVDDGALYGERIASSVQVKLKPNLAPGVYVVLWRTFTARTERLEDGFITFTFSP
jgi:copper resistance protein C